MKRLISILIAATIISFSFKVFAATPVPSATVYASSLERVSELGVISSSVIDAFNPEKLLTRAKYAEMIVIAAGLQDEADTLKGDTVYSDVDPNGEKNGYINEAAKKGFIIGTLDGKFHPDSSISFAQFLTSVIRALGYTDQDLSGTSPKNYIDKANALGLTAGISLDKSTPVPMWAAVMVFDKLLDTNIKKTNQSEADRAFSIAFSKYSELIILGNSKTQDNLDEAQVLTDNGVYYLANTGVDLELGNKYRLMTSGDRITKVGGKVKTLKKVTVESLAGTYLTYTEGDQKKSMTLNSKTVYYYNGTKQNYDSLSNVIQPYSSIILSYNIQKSGFDYCVIFDPLYSEPEIATNVNTNTEKLGSIEFSADTPVYKDGKLIDKSQIKDKNVIYQVSDIWGLKKYISVSENKVDGVLKSVIPNVQSAKSVKIDDTAYEFSKVMDFTKLTGGIINVGDNVTVLLDSENKIIDILPLSSDNIKNYAFVINFKTNYSGSSILNYSVKLLFTDGTTKTYTTSSNPALQKGRLVNFTLVDENTVTLSDIIYSSTGQFTISKDNGQINSAYADTNVKIFNIVSDDSDQDTNVSLLKWSDLPAGTFPGSKLLYMKNYGDFNDVSLILLDDIFDQNDRLAYVQKSAGGSSTLLIGGKQYTFGGALTPGSVVEVKLKGNGSIKQLVTAKLPQTTGYAVQARDSKRFKMNGYVYTLKNNLSVYSIDRSGNVTLKTIDDIETNRNYTSVSVYTDRDVSLGGKAEIITLVE